MAKKGRYIIKMDDGTNKEVSGDLFGEWWGIHKREDKLYALTHLPTGYRVWSSRLKTTLVMLIQEPEFCELPDHEDPAWRARVAKAIQRFCEKNTDLTTKKKKIGWE